MTFTIPKLLSPTHIRSAILKIVENFTNYPELNEDGKIDPSLIDVDSSNRFVTDTEKTTWNGKQSALGYTAENVSNKDSRNGYLGFTNNVIVVDINFLQNNLVYSNPYLYSSSAATGAGSYTSGGSVNTPKLRSGNDTQFRLPTLNLVGSVTGNVTTALNGVPAMTFKSPYKALFEQTIAYTDIGTKNNTFVVFAGDGARGATTFTGSLLMFVLNPLQNSGKWRVGKVISGGTPTYVNTDTSPTYNNCTKFSIYYNKSTEEALFYIDDTLVYTMTGVNLPDTTNFTLKMSLVREDSTETVATYATPVRQTIIYDLR